MNTEWLNPFNDPITYAIPAFLLLLVVESFINKKKNLNLYETKDSVASIGMGIGSVVVDTGIKGLVYSTMFFLHSHYALFDIQMTAWWAWLLLLLLDDFSFYWHHRFSHEVRILWAAHINHHSSQRYNLTTALRQSWVERLYKYLFWLWLPVIGFPPQMVLTMISFSLIYQYWIHTQTIGTLGFFEWFMNTPAHHRLHHAANPAYLDCNYGGIFIIWDRLFGSFQAKLSDEEPIYGITKNIYSYNLLHIAFHEYINTWRDLKIPVPFVKKLGFLFMPPGWSADGNHRTSRIVKREAEKKRQLTQFDV